MDTFLNTCSVLHAGTRAAELDLVSGRDSAPSEVVIGIDEGVKRDSAVNLDHVQTVDKSRFCKFVGTLGRDKMTEVCRALAIATGCA